MKRSNSDKPGYGAIRAVQNGVSKTFTVHRLAHELFIGPVGKAHVLHSCDNSICINPKHLRIGSHKDNIRDAVSRQRYATKIPSRDVVRIVALLDLGVPQTVIARAWGVSDAAISSLKNRQYFKTVTASARRKETNANTQDDRS